MHHIISVLVQHDIRLSALAAIICAIACVTTINLCARSREVAAPTALAWLSGAATFFGCGVWSLHFVAMWAWMPEKGVSFDLTLTILSVILACAGSMVAFSLWRFIEHATTGSLASGLALGVTISAMHHLGVSAMRGYGISHIDVPRIIVSVLLGVGLASASMLRMHETLTRRRYIEVTLGLILSISGIHFIAMTAITMSIMPPARPGTSMSALSLAVVASGVGIATLSVFLALALIDRRLSSLAHQEIYRLRQLADITQEGILIHHQGTIREVNQALSRLLGFEGNNYIGSDVSTALGIGAAEVLHQHEILEESPAPFEINIVRKSDGQDVPLDTTIRSIVFNGEDCTIVALRDLSEQRRHERRIRYLALHDPLTQLPNRLLLQRRLQTALIDAKAHKVGVMFLDMDHFKVVNDILGHAGGDTVLIELSKRLLSAIGPKNILARIGGDEFVIVLTKINDQQDIIEYANNIQTLMKIPARIGERRINISLSIGAALYPNDGQSADVLLRRADAALYLAKRAGRSRYQLFDAALGHTLQRRVRLQRDLASAITNKNMTLNYQPLLNCTSERLEGYEALLRWRHPEYGLISPDEFIPIAEETGLILEIGEWGLNEACRQAALWPTNQRIAVNLSPIQFQATDLTERIASALRIHGISPNRLELEITEATLIQAQSTATETIKTLRSLGVQVSLDDFGTGYSSLNYLHRFPVDCIKIDRSFTQDLGQKKVRTVVQAIIQLGHNLNIRVAAEGVETHEQLALLRLYNCDQVQGFLLGRPIPMPVSHAANIVTPAINMSVTT